MRDESMYSRRNFLRVGGTAAGALAFGGVLAACGGGKSGGGPTDGEFKGISDITLVNWGGTTTTAIDEAWGKPFAKASGVGVKVTSPIDYGKFKAQVDSGKIQWNWLDSEGYFPFREPDLLAKLDPAEMGINTADLVEFPNNVIDNGICDYLSAHVIAYRTDNDKRHPRTWEEFFDVKGIPGKRALYNYPYAMLEIALLGDGVPFDKLYPLDVQRAFTKIDSIRDDLVFFNSGAESQQLLSGGGADFVTPWHNRAGFLAMGGEPVGIEWNQNLLLRTYHVIPRDDPKAPATKAFIKSTLELQPQLDFARLSGLGPVLKEATTAVDDKLKPLLPTTPENWDVAAGFVDDNWWGPNYTDVSKQWYEWQGA